MGGTSGETDLTPNERELLRALASSPGRWFTPAELQAAGLLANRSVQGLHRTAVSLVDKGLAERTGNPGRSLRYHVTLAGLSLLSAGNDPGCSLSAG
jgi:predicted transcriptional regulator